MGSVTKRALIQQTEGCNPRKLDPHCESLWIGSGVDIIGVGTRWRSQREVPRREDGRNTRERLRMRDEKRRRGRLERTGLVGPASWTLGRPGSGAARSLHRYAPLALASNALAGLATEGASFVQTADCEAKIGSRSFPGFRRALG